MSAHPHRIYSLGHITELHQLSDSAVQAFQQVVPALVALFKLQEAQKPGSLQSTWPQLQFSNRPGGYVHLNRVPFSAEQLLEAVHGMGVTLPAAEPRHTYRLSHITDLVQIADEHIPAFQADIPMLVATLQVAATQLEAVPDAGTSLAEVFPHLTFAPELGDALVLRTPSSTRVVTGADVRAASRVSEAHAPETPQRRARP